jgi:hypothetical protein
MAGNKAGTKVAVGKRVRVQGLNGRAELNGKFGIVLQVKEEEKFTVKLDEGTEIILKAANLVLDGEEPKLEGKQPEPKAKRARFSDDIEIMEDCAQSAAEGTVDEVQAEDDEGSENEDPPYSTWANKAVTLRFIKSKTDAGISFNLKKGFTHQVLRSMVLNDPIFISTAHIAGLLPRKKSQRGSREASRRADHRLR